MKQFTVYESIVLNNLCIGCGVCTLTCPRRRLSVHWNSKGYYSVSKDDQMCAKNCSLCLKVCPFADNGLNEDELSRVLYGQVPGIKFKKETGFFQACYAGYSLRNEQRLLGASGGVATWFLTELLRSNLVDHVVCVTADSAPDPLFKYSVCDTEDKVQLSARSAYYPVEMSNVLKSMQESGGRYAIVCLPCYAKAIRLACRVNKKLERQIVCIVGLVCGHGANRFFAEYATEKAGGDAHTMERVTFRTKNPSYPASNLGTECMWKDSEDNIKRNTTYWHGGMGKVWAGYWFTPDPCLYCDDIFSETADIVFMDAWLKEYIQDFRGTNLIAVRSALAVNICNQGLKSQAVNLESCDVDQLIKSQAGVVDNKRDGLAYRLWISQQSNAAPIKRVNARKVRGFLRRLRWRNQVKAVEIGPSSWQARRSINDYESHIARLNRMERILTRMKYVILEIYRLPIRFVRNFIK